MNTTKRILCLLLVLVTLCSMMVPAVSAASTTPYDAFNNTSYGRTYTLATSGRQTVYTGPELQTPGNIERGACNAWIDCAADELRVFDVGESNGSYWAFVSYPVSGGRRTGYIPLSAITANAYSVSATATGKFYCSPRKGQSINSSYYVDKNDRVYLIAVDGDLVQLVYPSSGGRYRMAWAKKSDWIAYCGSIPGSSSGSTKPPSGTTTAPTNGSFVRIRYVVNGRYLDVPAEGISYNGTQLQLWDYAPGNQNQIFYLTDTGKGWRITSLQSGKVIEVRNSSHDDCAQVAQWDKHDLACARWDIVKNSDGSVSFRNCESGKYLNVCGGGNAGNGTKMIQYHDDKSSAMRFYIEPVTISGYSAVTGTIPSSKVKQEKDLSIRSWHPLNGLTQTMLEQEGTPENKFKLSDKAEAFNTTVDAVGFILSWVCNSGEVTRIHVTEGTNGQISIRYGTAIEQIRSGKKMSLAAMLTEAHPGEASYVLWAASDADKCIRNWFGLSGNGKYSMNMSFGKVKFGEYGYAIVIENGAVRQIPLIHPDSTYDVYYKENKKTTYVMDAANILRNAKLPLADDEARTVMIQLVKNGYIK